MIYCKKYNITVGPEEEAVHQSEHYDLILNVSDTEPREVCYDKCKWYPIQEMSNWGYGPFYWSKKILDKAVAENKKILIHCHAGANRSPSTLIMYLLSLGHNVIDLYKMGIGEGYIQTVTNNLAQNHIPNDMKLFYKTMDENPTWSLMGILHSMNHVYAH